MMQDSMPKYFHPLYSMSSFQSHPHNSTPLSWVNLTPSTKDVDLLNVLTNNLPNLNQQNNIFKVILNNSKARDHVNSSHYALQKFITKLSKMAVSLNTFLLSVKVHVLSFHNASSLTFQFMSVLRRLHSLQSKFIIDSAHQKLIDNCVFVTLLHLPLLHMTRLYGS